MDAMDLLVDAAAAFRLTRLVTTDTFPPVQALRNRLSPTYEGRRNGEPGALEELVNCDWCAGMWVALAVVAARSVAPRAWRPLVRALAMSAAAAMLGTHFNQD